MAQQPTGRSLPALPSLHTGMRRSQDISPANKTPQRAATSSTTPPPGTHSHPHCSAQPLAHGLRNSALPRPSSGAKQVRFHNPTRLRSLRQCRQTDVQTDHPSDPALQDAGSPGRLVASTSTSGFCGARLAQQGVQGVSDVCINSRRPDSPTERLHDICCKRI
jgi:hypothetical protein